ncbi:unnamed protein product [Polarella glacialis]|uniref:Uncharacterized protein n=1 Tax=Polarella glacialis TaxID=89957 RepID=A0A813JW21_POLGL|nr:unnamed protein product [Polarella glacialis]
MMVLEQLSAKFWCERGRVIGKVLAMQSFSKRPYSWKGGSADFAHPKILEQESKQTGLPFIFFAAFARFRLRDVADFDSGLPTSWLEVTASIVRYAVDKETPAGTYTGYWRSFPSEVARLVQVEQLQRHFELRVESASRCGLVFASSGAGGSSVGSGHVFKGGASSVSDVSPWGVTPASSVEPSRAGSPEPESRRRSPSRSPSPAPTLALMELRQRRLNVLRSSPTPSVYSVSASQKSSPHPSSDASTSAATSLSLACTALSSKPCTSRRAQTSQRGGASFCLSRMGTGDKSPHGDGSYSLSSSVSRPQTPHMSVDATPRNQIPLGPGSLLQAATVVAAMHPSRPQTPSHPSIVEMPVILRDSAAKAATTMPAISMSRPQTPAQPTRQEHGLPASVEVAAVAAALHASRPQTPAQSSRPQTPSGRQAQSVPRQANLADGLPGTRPGPGDADASDSLFGHFASGLGRVGTSAPGPRMRYRDLSPADIGRGLTQPLVQGQGGLPSAQHPLTMSRGFSQSAPNLADMRELLLPSRRCSRQVQAPDPCQWQARPSRAPLADCGRNLMAR